MKDRPIIFKGEMVRAILAGTKTQTRRVVKPGFRVMHGINPDGSLLTNRIFRDGSNIRCLYGTVGDRLWVRETFMPMPHLNAKAFYRASDPLVGGKWKPAIFMPRSLSRITLEITGVRVQRVQDISEADAIAEGVTIKPDAGIAAIVAKDTPARMEFWHLWESINKNWNSNPWVWVLEFRREP